VPPVLLLLVCFQFHTRAFQAQAETLVPLMQRRIPKLHLDHANFSDAVQFLHELTGDNIVLDEPAIKVAGIDPAPITLNETDITISDAMKALVDQAGNGKLSFAASNDVVVISTAEAIKTAATRPSIVVASTQPGAGDKRLLALLNRSLPSVPYQETSLADAIDFLRNLTGAEIDVDWRAVKAAGANPDAAMTMNLHDVTFAAAIQVVLEVGGDHKLDCVIDGNVIDILPDSAGSPAGEQAFPPRGNEGNAVPAVSSPVDIEAAKRTQKGLETPIPTIAFDKVPLTDALDSLGEISHEHIVVRWSVLKSAGVDVNAPVSGNFTDANPSTVLQSVLDQAGKGKLSYKVDDWLIVITSSSDKH
jgi:hypothetical protein